MAARSEPGFVAVSPNPAIDRVARIDGAAAGIVHATELLETPGGKAVHAACVASQLGADSAVITTVGGRSGGLLLDLLAAEPLDVIEVRVAGGAAPGPPPPRPPFLYLWGGRPPPPPGPTRSSGQRAGTWSRSTSHRVP